jgi:hypothetical protein
MPVALWLQQAIFLKKWATNGVITKLYCANDVQHQHQAQYSYRPSLAKSYALPHLTHKRNLPPLCLTLLL